MYSVVLLMALSTGADVPSASFPGRCFGGPGPSGWSNCFAGRACSGSGSYSVFNNSTQSQGRQCHGGADMVVTPAAAPAAPKAAPSPAPEKIQPPKEEATAREALIVVTLPAGAKLSFDGRSTQQDTETRRFVTPPLEPGKVMYYRLRAEMVLAGRNRVVTQQIMIRAGEETRVLVDFASAEVIVSR